MSNNIIGRNKTKEPIDMEEVKLRAKALDGGNLKDATWGTKESLKEKYGDLDIIECPKCNGKYSLEDMCEICENTGKLYMDEDGIVWGVGDKVGE